MSSPSDTLTLYIRADQLGLYTPPPRPLSTDQEVNASLSVQPPVAPRGLVGLLTGRLADFELFAGHEHSAWLLDMAHDICDPRLRRGTLNTAAADPLAATDYVYVLPAGVVVGAAQVVGRALRSVTSSDNATAATMRAAVTARDRVCWINGIGPVTNARILPKRMGAALARRVLADFSPAGSVPRTTPATSVFDAIFGVSLSLNMEHYFRPYDLGFRVRDASQNEYTCHVFAVAAPGDVHTIFGYEPAAHPFRPVLHGHRAAPPQPNPQANNLPPPAVFRWHYLQCVLKRFGHPDYAALPHIDAPTVPVRFAYDDDEGGGE